jgi:hypothetical protein
MKLTNLQIITVVLLLLYVIWEISVQIWDEKEETAVIRGDLAFIYPILLVLIIFSLFQYFRSKNQ